MELRKLPDFSSKERDILHLLANYHTRMYICKDLRISYNTLDRHMRLIFAKTQLHSQVDVMQYAREHGFGTS